MKSYMVSRPGFGILVLRVVLGAVFIAHGIDKLQHIQGVIGFFASLGLASFFAYAIAWIELLSGIAMLLGIFTKLAGYLIAGTMIVAIFLVKYKIGFLGGYELDLTLLAAALAIVWSGPGMWCVKGIKSSCDGCDMCKGGCNHHEGK